MLVDELFVIHITLRQEYSVLLHMSKSQLTEWKLTGVEAATRSIITFVIGLHGSPVTALDLAMSQSVRNK